MQDWYRLLQATACHISSHLPTVKKEVIQAGKTLTRAQKLSLICEVTKEEITMVVHNIDDNKVPRSDGHNAYFYNKAWPIIGDDIAKVVL